MTSPTPGLTAFPSPTDLTLWTATLTGPQGTPYENLTFKLSLSYPANYPYAPPDVRFVTPIYHPNVDFAGRICLDILKQGAAEGEGAWSAVLNTGSVLLSVQSLLGEPNKCVYSLLSLPPSLPPSLPSYSMHASGQWSGAAEGS